MLINKAKKTHNTKTNNQEKNNPRIAAKRSRGFSGKKFVVHVPKSTKYLFPGRGSSCQKTCYVDILFVLGFRINSSAKATMEAIVF